MGGNTLFGGTDFAADTLIGGADSDIYRVYSNDIIVEVAGGGTADRMRALAIFTLADGQSVSIR